MSDTVLIVDTDSAVRETAGFIVEDAGYHVLQASGAVEAIAMLEKEDVQILFTDINIRGWMNGVALGAYVRTQWPHIGLLLTSGAHGEQDFVCADRHIFLSKPYRLADVTFALDRLAK